MTEEKIKILNSLLRGERSATETYVEVVKKIDEPDKLDPILKMQSDHIDAVKTLKNAVVQAGGQPETDSGLWGTWATTITKAASLFGDKSSLKALKEGEEHGAKEYESAIEKDFYSNEEKTMLRNLYDTQNSHIQTINRYL